MTLSDVSIFPYRSFRQSKWDDHKLCHT